MATEWERRDDLPCTEEEPTHEAAGLADVGAEGGLMTPVPQLGHIEAEPCQRGPEMFGGRR